MNDVQNLDGRAPATVTFVHSTENSASPENVVLVYDFGDGSDPQTVPVLRPIVGRSTGKGLIEVMRQDKSLPDVALHPAAMPECDAVDARYSRGEIPYCLVNTCVRRLAELNPQSVAMREMGRRVFLSFSQAIFSL